MSQPHGDKCKGPFMKIMSGTRFIKGVWKDRSEDKTVACGQDNKDPHAN